VAESLADPDGIESLCLACEEVSHLLGVKLDELNLALADAEKSISVFISRASRLARLCLGKPLCYLNLLG
jgi:hypothetical protein